MDPRRRHGRLLAPALAVILAAELLLVALAMGPATLAGRSQDAAAAAARQGVVSTPGDYGAGHPADRLAIFRGGHPQWRATPAPAAVARPVVPSSPTPASAVSNVAVAATVPNPAAAPKPVRASGSTSTTTTAATVYRGTNHVWMPSLGVSRSVSWYPCSRTTALANVVYRWGCAGKNNVYLMGHAWGVFRPLYNAYYNGKLRKGMVVIYADANGRVTRYKVTFWKVVSPVGAEWAYASQSRPSMTLQTCIGSRSQYRLVVRLVASG
jgi:hypothetical protein